MWDLHSVDGWYLHTSNEHYRTHKCHVKGTRSERLSDTVQFLCKSITNPTKTVADKIMLAISHVADLVEDKGKNEEAEKAIRESVWYGQQTKHSKPACSTRRA